MPKPSTRCLAAEAGARTEGFIKRREIEGHTTSNLFYIQHMQTKFAALHLFFFLGCLETSSAQLSLDFMIRRSKDVQVKLQHFNTLQDLLHAEINHHLIHIILPRSELLNAFEFSWNKSSTVPHWDLIVVQRFITEACRSRSTRKLTHELWWKLQLLSKLWFTWGSLLQLISVVKKTNYEFLFDETGWTYSRIYCCDILYCMRH